VAAPAERLGAAGAETPEMPEMPETAETVEMAETAEMAEGARESGSEATKEPDEKAATLRCAPEEGNGFAIAAVVAKLNRHKSHSPGDNQGNLFIGRI
jgi:hypothetical protein